MASTGVHFEKGHGTGNDFVLLPDFDGRYDLSPSATAQICDRRTGIGGDGLIRVVRSSSLSHEELLSAAAVETASQAQWFMDYRNADGSIASMCGNGARVFARYLLDEGLAVGPEFTIMTRGGSRAIRVDAEGTISVEMGQPVNGPGSSETIVSIGSRRWVASPWWLPNPHAVVWVDDLAEAGSLVSAPEVVSDRFVDGVNVEFAVDRTDEFGPRASMRVYERGVGETASCGTGACAVALALRDLAGRSGPMNVPVDVPGGHLSVSFDEDDRIWLTGPAVLVASGEISGLALSGDPS